MRPPRSRPTAAWPLTRRSLEAPHGVAVPLRALRLLAVPLEHLEHADGEHVSRRDALLRAGGPSELLGRAPGQEQQRVHGVHEPNGHSEDGGK